MQDNQEEGSIPEGPTDNWGTLLYGCGAGIVAFVVLGFRPLLGLLGMVFTWLESRPNPPHWLRPLGEFMGIAIVLSLLTGLFFIVRDDRRRRAQKDQDDE